MSAKFTPPGGSADDQQATDSGHRRAIDLWYAEASARLSHMLCTDAEIAGHQRMRTRRKFYGEMMAGTDWTAATAEQVGDKLNRQPIPADLLAIEAETIRCITEVRDAIAERFQAEAKEGWPTLFLRVMRDRSTLRELEEGRWIPRMPLQLPERKPTDERGMAERMRDAEKTAKMMR